MTTKDDELHRRMIRHAAASLWVDSGNPDADCATLAKRMKRTGELVLSEIEAVTELKRLAAKKTAPLPSAPGRRASRRTTCRRRHRASASRPTSSPSL